MAEHEHVWHENGPVGSEPYTPTEDEVRDAWVLTFTRNHDAYMTGVPLADKRDVVGAEFDRFLAQVRAEARREGAVEALRSAASVWLSPARRRDTNPALWLRARADRIEAEG